tara:strand:+ start:745 stop:1026 length:282 start_codon:yes stop_codon:yes gene_type:complete
VKVKEIMERAGITETGRAIAYIKDALEEINLEGEAQVKTEKIDIKQNKRFYSFPSDMVKILEIRCKNHLNSENEYRKIPRLLHEPKIVDADGE